MWESYSRPEIGSRESLKWKDICFGKTRKVPNLPEILLWSEYNIWARVFHSKEGWMRTQMWGGLWPNTALHSSHHTTSVDFQCTSDDKEFSPWYPEGITIRLNLKLCPDDPLSVQSRVWWRDREMEEQLPWEDTQSPGVRAVEALIADVDVDVRKNLEIDRHSRVLCLTIVLIHDFWSFFASAQVIPRPPYLPPACPDTHAAVPLYRAYSSGATDHFYTTDKAEMDCATSSGGYTAEGITGYIFPTQVTQTVPLYRSYSASGTDHFYTINKAESDSAVASGKYSYEGITGYVFPSSSSSCPGAAPWYRSWQLTIIDHFYTMSAPEKDNAVSNNATPTKASQRIFWFPIEISSFSFLTFLLSFQ